MVLSNIPSEDVAMEDGEAMAASQLGSARGEERTQWTVLSDLRVFFIIWFGQFVSHLGSGLTSFGLGVWVYQTTGSATQFALIALAATVPGILLSPIAGALVDRWDRRKAMMLSDAGSGVCTGILALLLLTGKLQVWHICLGAMASAVFSAVQWPAWSAAVAMLVPKQYLGRANGIDQTGQAIVNIASPVLAGVLVTVVGLWGVILVDFGTFLVALLTLAVVRIPRPQATTTGAAARGSLLKEAAFGWHFILARRGLLALLCLFAAGNFLVGIVNILFTPYVLRVYSPAVLGGIMSAGGMGMLAGSLIMSAWGGPRRRVNGIIVIWAVEGLMCMVIGFWPTPLLLAAALFISMGVLPIVNGTSQVIWQSKVAPDIQGRVFAIRRMIAWSCIPLSYLIAGPLADDVFEPLLMPAGLLSPWLGQLLGTGAGRGTSLLYILLGLLVLAVTGIAALQSQLRHLESDVPDATPASSGA